MHCPMTRITYMEPLDYTIHALNGLYAGAQNMQHKSSFHVVKRQSAIPTTLYT